jgi:hypothetical protein
MRTICQFFQLLWDEEREYLLLTKYTYYIIYEGFEGEGQTWPVHVNCIRLVFVHFYVNGKFAFDLTCRCVNGIID